MGRSQRQQQMLPQLSYSAMRIAAYRLRPIMLAAVVIISEKPPALALDGYYMGQWATDKEACDAKASPNRIIFLQSDLLAPLLHCKLMGVRQDDETGTTFVAHCNDTTAKWNDEITVKASITRLTLKLRTDGRELHLLRCIPPATKQIR
jgi:hypothetical protein